MVNGFGKELARRARSCCELCEKCGVPLRVVEMPPSPREPEIERCLMLCEECESALLEPKQFRSGEHWRCLATTVWSEVPAVQVAAVRLLKRLSVDQDWAREALDGVFLDEELESWVTEAE